MLRPLFGKCILPWLTLTVETCFRVWKTWSHIIATWRFQVKFRLIWSCLFCGRERIHWCGGSSLVGRWCDIHQVQSFRMHFVGTKQVQASVEEPVGWSLHPERLLRHLWNVKALLANLPPATHESQTNSRVRHSSQFPDPHKHTQSHVHTHTHIHGYSSKWNLNIHDASRDRSPKPSVDRAWAMKRVEFGICGLDITIPPEENNRSLPGRTKEGLLWSQIVVS